MRMSCNGCRVLRKGCNENCSIQPCLRWIKNPEAQGHATVFLAKFYGRAGLLNLINSGPTHLRPGIFKSLLYEACGRIVNPIHGSVGLVWSGRWAMVQAAVDAVLKGAPIVSISSDSAASGPGPYPTYGIRHVYKTGLDAKDAELHKVSKTTRTRFRFKRTAQSGKVVFPPVTENENDHEPSHSHSHSHSHHSSSSVDTLEAGSHVSHCEPSPAGEREDLLLDLTLGLDAVRVRSKPSKQLESTSGDSIAACSFHLHLQLSA